MLYLEVSSLRCLHVSTTFLDLQSYGLGSSYTVSRGVYAPRAPWAGQLPRFHYLDYFYYAGPEMISSRAQLLLGLNQFGNIPSLNLPLPQILFQLFF